MRKWPLVDRKILRMKRLINLCEKQPTWLEIKIAGNDRELGGAYRLLHDVYVESGFMYPHPSGMRISNYNFLSTTVTFLAKVYEKIVGTVTLIEDSELGLPVEEVYPKEINSLRKSSFKLAEVSGLAIEKHYRFKNICLHLNYNLAIHAILTGITDLVIAVNPRHLTFYHDLLLFRVIGPKRFYDRVNGAPAIAMHLNLERLEARLERFYNLNFQSLHQKNIEITNNIRIHTI